MYDLQVVNKEYILEDVNPAQDPNRHSPANKGLSSLVDLYLNDGEYYYYDPILTESAHEDEIQKLINVDYITLATMLFADQPAPNQPKWWHHHAVHIHETPTRTVTKLDFNGGSAHNAFSLYLIQTITE